MSRAAGLRVFCAIVLGWVPPAAGAQTPVPGSTSVTVTATIAAIDQEKRAVTLKAPDGKTIDVTASEQVEGFRSLRVGDQVTATYFDAIAIGVRKPGDPAPASAPTTITVRKDRAPGSETRREQTLRGTIEAVDAAAASVRVKGPQQRVVTLAVRDPTQLQNVKPGDTVDVTYYESLLVTVARPKKP
jgi:hypothetical protein